MWIVDLNANIPAYPSFVGSSGLLLSANTIDRLALVRVVLHRYPGRTEGRR
jgi:hypothetical protein